MANTRNHYEILESNPTAAQDAIKKNYRRLSLLWHPDKNLHRRKEAEEKIKDINEAYEILSDPETRKIYDDSLLASQQEEKIPAQQPQKTSTTQENNDEYDYPLDQEDRAFYFKIWFSEGNLTKIKKHVTCKQMVTTIEQHFPLYYARRNNHHDVLRYCYEKAYNELTATEHLRYDNGYTIFHWAIWCLQPSEIPKLQAKYNLNFKERLPLTTDLLYRAAAVNLTKLAHYFCSQGASPDMISPIGAREDGKVSLFWHAALYSCLDQEDNDKLTCVEILLQCKANVNSCSSISRITPILLAIEYQHINLLHLLLKVDAHLSIPSTEYFDSMYKSVQKELNLWSQQQRKFFSKQQQQHSPLLLIADYFQYHCNEESENYFKLLIIKILMLAYQKGFKDLSQFILPVLANKFIQEYLMSPENAKLLNLINKLSIPYGYTPVPEDELHPCIHSSHIKNVYTTR